jgi:hypothetical protein
MDNIDQTQNNDILKHEFHILTQNSLYDTESVAVSLDLAMRMIIDTRDFISKELNNELIDHPLMHDNATQQRKTDADYDNIDTIALVDLFKQRHPLRLHGLIERGRVYVPKLFLSSLVSQFDFFLARLLRTIDSFKPEFMHIEHKQVTLQRAMSALNMESLRSELLEHEIDKLLFGDRLMQFDIFIKDHKIGLNKIPFIKEFYEVYFRRNLLVHCDGRVSQIYIDNCNNIGINIPPSITVGSTLGVDSSYFVRAVYLHMALEAILVQLVWRNILPSQAMLADRSLNTVLFEMNDLSLFTISTLIGDSLFNVIKYSDDIQKATITINYATAKKMSGAENECEQLIINLDVNELPIKYKLAKTVLLEQYDRAIEYMNEANINPSSMHKIDYIVWPLFKKFRTTTQFLDTYKLLYKEEYVERSDEKTIPISQPVAQKPKSTSHYTKSKRQHRRR